MTESASVFVLVDVPGLHCVKENYTDEMLHVSFAFSLNDEAAGGKHALNAYCTSRERNRVERKRSDFVWNPFEWCWSRLDR